MTDTDRDSRLKKLSFRSWRRGFREADLILGNFSDKFMADMTDAELDIYERLLNVPDQDLFGWIIGRSEEAPEHKSDILNKIKEFHKSVHVDVMAGKGA
mgnify:CR=1 FL=1